jgi:para-aminobenzoate synthetase/4-amino-4-deoxychorismate lyase
VHGNTQVEAEPVQLPDANAVWRYVVADHRIDSCDPRFHHKTTLRALYDGELAAAKSATDCDEVVFLNERGEVAEGSRTTIFVERDGVWLTPPLASGALDGCLRRELIERGPQRVVERVLYPDDLAQGGVWLGNSLRGAIRAMPCKERSANKALHVVGLEA